MRAIVVVAVLMLGATEASARKFHFFHVSGGGGGEQIVKVLELPDIPALRRADGRHIDLGYKFKSGGGEWVGYVGDDGKYLPLSGDAVHALLAVAGIDRLPPVPERPASTESGAGSVFKAILMPVWRQHHSLLDLFFLRRCFGSGRQALLQRKNRSG